jgi:hypothetical protein
MGEAGRRDCPDGGACHHDCGTSCWRVATCLPLSASGWKDWPAKVRAANPPTLRIENLLIGGESDG